MAPSNAASPAPLPGDGAPAGGRPPAPGHGDGDDTWATAITRVRPDSIRVRGYRLDEIMGRLSFGEAIYLLLVGELPSPALGRLSEAVLVSAIDHGVQPPSTLAARTVAGTGAPPRAAAAAGVLALGSQLGGGGSIEASLRFLEEGIALVDDWVSPDDAARRLLDHWTETAGGDAPPGFGHRRHSRDPRAARLLQLAFELDVDGTYAQLARALEQELSERRTTAGKAAVSLNVDGAIAAICGDIGFDAETATMLFTIARVPGLVAHSLEEQRREAAMRPIDPARHVYDGPKARRLPDSPL